MLRDVLTWLPGASTVAFYRYSFPAIAFAFAVLAALGIDGIATQLPRRRHAIVVSVLALGVLVVLAYEAHRLVDQLSGNASHWEWAQIAWTAAVAGAVAMLSLRRVRAHGAVLAGLLIADVALMFGLRELAAPRSVRVDRAPVTYLQRHLGLQRFFTLGPIAPNYGGYWRLASLNDIDIPLPKTWTTYVNASLDSYVNAVFFVGNYGGARPLTVPSPAHELIAHVNAYRDAAVSYVVTLPQQRLPGPAFKLVRRTRVASIYRLTGSAGYFSTAATCAVAPEDRQRVRVGCPQPATLLRRELSFPGWSAAVDGHDVPIRTADSIFQSVSVPAGVHTVSFSYAPPYFEISLVGLLLGTALLAAGCLGNRVSTPSHHSLHLHAGNGPGGRSAQASDPPGG